MKIVKKITFVKIDEIKLKSEICESILRRLPLWFGIESAIVDYVNDVKRMQTWVVYENDQVIGFASVNRHFPESAEIHVMGILQEYHGQGIGSRLIKTIKNDLNTCQMMIYVHF